MATNRSEALKQGDAGDGQPPVNLDTILAMTWMQFVKGAERSAEPFHLGVLATSGVQGPSLRTVVLRAVYPKQRVLLCHTDSRSEKLMEIRNDERVAWLFYDPDKKLQVRLRGKAAVRADDSLAKSQWQRTRLSSRRCYLAAQRPGTPIATDRAEPPAPFDMHSPTLAESEQGWAHFAVVACQIEALDWLQLSVLGHQRAQFLWQGKQWHASWVAP